nr:uncharacterized protein LOC114927581 [Arachis hypogaea]
MEFFQREKLPSDVNTTWVTLAPKFVGAKEIKDFRPISLVGYVYKVISKVLVRRMRSVMPGLVGETHTAFVKDRKIHDGAFIASLEELGEECVSMASMSVLVNGSPSKPFNMERGLRQGDPLSPFLFVQVVNMLHWMLGEAVSNGRIDPLLVRGEHIELSHLQFADDTILFEWVDYVCGLLGCKQAVLPVRYLGISLGVNPRLVKTWKPIIDKVEEKLSLRKAKVLNKAGKLVLIKSVLNSLPIYYLSLYKMPKAVADKLIALQMRFMWCKGDGNDGIPLVKWEMVQAPKKARGLGVGDAMLWNTALLFKWWWQFSKEDCPLWKKIICLYNNLNLAVWYSWLRSFGEDWAIPGTIRELFESWTGRHKQKQEQKKWLTGFFTVIWNIWVERNARIFNNKEAGVTFVERRTFLSYKEWMGSDPFGC